MSSIAIIIVLIGGGGVQGQGKGQRLIGIKVVNDYIGLVTCQSKVIFFQTPLSKSPFKTCGAGLAVGYKKKFAHLDAVHHDKTSVDTPGPPGLGGH